MLKKEHPAFNPYIGVVLAVVAISFSAIFTKMSSAPPLVIAFYRLAFTVLLLTPLALSRAGRDEIKGMSIRDLVLAILAGLFLSLHFSVWIASLSYTSVASSTVLVTMQPLFVVAGGYLFLKERIGQRALAGAALSLAGSAMIGLNDSQLGGGALWGDLLAFSGAFFVAVYVLIGRILRSGLSLFPYVFIVYGSSALFLLLFNIISGTCLYPYPGSDWTVFLALALIPTILGHTVFNWALRYVKAAVVSVSILGEPVGATALAYFVFHEVPGPLQLLGMSVIIGGLYIFISYSSAKADKPEKTTIKGTAKE